MLFFITPSNTDMEMKIHDGNSNSHGATNAHPDITRNQVTYETGFSFVVILSSYSSLLSAADVVKILNRE